jgi:hypothetical protein
MKLAQFVARSFHPSFLRKRESSTPVEPRQAGFPLARE